MWRPNNQRAQYLSSLACQHFIVSNKQEVLLRPMDEARQSSGHFSCWWTDRPSDRDPYGHPANVAQTEDKRDASRHVRLLQPVVLYKRRILKTLKTERVESTGGADGEMIWSSTPPRSSLSLPSYSSLFLTQHHGNISLRPL